MPIEEHDQKNHWRCPMLGGPVPFSHCRKTNGGLPCGKTIQCWGGKFDADGFIKSNYSDDEIRRIFSPAPSRLEQIFDTAEKFTNPDGNNK